MFPPTLSPLWFVKEQKSTPPLSLDTPLLHATYCITKFVVSPCNMIVSHQFFYHRVLNFLFFYPDVSPPFSAVRYLDQVHTVLFQRST